MLSCLVVLGLAMSTRASPDKLTKTHCDKNWDVGSVRVAMPAGSNAANANNIAITATQLTTTIGSSYTSATSLDVAAFNVVAADLFGFGIKVGGVGSTVAEIKRGSTAVDAATEGPLAASTNCGYQKNTGSGATLTSTVKITGPTHGGDFDVWLATAAGKEQAFYTKKYSITDSTTCAAALTAGADTITTTPSTTAGAKAGSTATFTCPTGKVASGTATCSKGTWTTVTCKAQQDAASATDTSLVAVALVVAAVMAN